MPSETLTEKERRFIDAFLGECRGNGTQAAIAAGYSGRSANSAHVQANRLLRKATIAAAIAARQDTRERKAIADADERDTRLTAIIRNLTSNVNDVIRAISEMNRCAGRHSVGVKHSGGMTLEELVTGSRQIDG